MNTALWIVQGVLGVMFTMAGTVKFLSAKEKLAARMPWVNSFSAVQVKLIGLSQVLGGIGLVLPWYLGIAPILTPVAAAALCFVMLAAAVYHLNHKEYSAIGVNAFLFALALVIAIGRS